MTSIDSISLAAGVAFAMLACSYVVARARYEAHVTAAMRPATARPDVRVARRSRPIVRDRIRLAS